MNSHRKLGVCWQLYVARHDWYQRFIFSQQPWPFYSYYKSMIFIEWKEVVRYCLMLNLAPSAATENTRVCRNHVSVVDTRKQRHL
jgi:hypothetical protein